MKIAETCQTTLLKKCQTERSNYVAPYDREDQIVKLVAKAYADWSTDNLPRSSVPAIGTMQAVYAILSELKI